MAAHFASVFPKEDDNDADRLFSVVGQISIAQGRLYVGASASLLATQPEGELDLEFIEANHNWQWSLSALHERLRDRYGDSLQPQPKAV